MRNKQEMLVDPETEKRIGDLLARMTTEEKIGQLMQLSPSIFGAFGETMDELIQKLVNGEMSGEQFAKLERHYHEDDIREGRIGSMGGIIGADKANELQRIAVEESRLGIPLLFGFDVIHGFRTVFPIPLAEACSWEPELLRATAAVAAKEAAAAGLHWTYAPMVDVARDPRWGRIAEGAGEDPYLGSVMAAARVEGFQGDLSSPDNVLACAKHFAAYGAAVGGRDYNTVDISPQTLHDVYLPPFEAAARAGAATFMTAFNDLNGVPCTANNYLLQDVLRGQFGFNGFVISDANAVAELTTHGFAETRKAASRLALCAGVDMDMSHGTYLEDLTTLADEGALPIPVLDEAVKRVLRIKFKLGLFNNPYRTDAAKEKATMLVPEHIEVARDAARRSIVLLKNERKTLPLQRDIRKIAVIGPLADSAADLLGSWVGAGRPEDAVTILTGIRNAVHPATEVVYERGCGVADDGRDHFAAAVRAAEASDVVIAVLGEDASMSGEAASRIEIGLPGRQEELLRELHRTGKPVVLLLVNGRPLTIPWAEEHVPAIVEAWQLGVQGGNAVADVLFGNYNPSGKLVVTFPRSTGQIPLYYNHPNTGRPAGSIKFTSKYIDGPAEPLYPFGFGLSYTTFQYGNLTVTPPVVDAQGEVNVEIEVTNAGDREGEEVVQLYVADPVASRVRPVKELKGFRKVALAPGETRKVQFRLPITELAFSDEHLNTVVEPGEFRVFVGTNARDGIEASFAVTSWSNNR